MFGLSTDVEIALFDEHSVAREVPGSFSGIYNDKRKCRDQGLKSRGRNNGLAREKPVLMRRWILLRHYTGSVNKDCQGQYGDQKQ